MLSKREIARYKRQLILPEIGTQGQLALRHARVLIIGAGGLGNAVLPYLAAAGVGHLTVVDQDIVNESNLHRQVCFTENDLGKFKSQVMVEKLKALNSLGNYQFITEYLTSTNAIELFKNQDIVIDCVDQLPVRYLLNDVAVYYGIPFVYGAIHKFEGQVAVFNYQGGATYRCAFPENTELQSPPSCEEVGVIGVLPGIIGMYQAMETIKIITNAGQVLSNKLMLIDILNHRNHSIQITRKKETIDLAKTNVARMLQDDISEIIEVSGKELAQVISDNPMLKIIDIRPVKQRESLYGIGVTHIPVAELKNAIGGFDKSQSVLLYCAHGVKSLWATQLLQQEKFKKVYHLVGGINAI